MTRKRKRRPTADHVIMGNNSLRCSHCGAEVTLPMPISMRMFQAMADAMIADHEGCQPSSSGAAHMEYSSPEEWAASWDTGLSSLAIYRYMKNGTHPKADEIPRDPADLGRCLRLLAVAPGWTERLPELAQAAPAWAPLIGRWDDLRALHQEEEPSGAAPRCFELMKELLGGAR